MQWLRMGWNDMRENLGASLSYGVILAAIGYTILSYSADKPYLFMAAISGFMLIGPLAAAGLYEISRRYEKGEKVSFIGSIRGLAQCRRPRLLRRLPRHRAASPGSASRRSCSRCSTVAKSAT
jgi:uncharacterized membrane protein